MIQAYWEGVKNCLVWTESLKCLRVENLEEGRGKKNQQEWKILNGQKQIRWQNSFVKKCGGIAVIWDI